MKQSMPKKGESDAGGGVICVQDIEAPKDAVWNQILRMDDYVKKVPKVLECKNYDVRKGEGGNFIMKTKQRLGVLPGYSVSTCICSFSNASACWSELTPSALTFPCNKQYENYYEHTYAPDKDSLVWRLDYNKRSDFDDVAGHWYVSFALFYTKRSFVVLMFLISPTQSMNPILLKRRATPESTTHATLSSAVLSQVQFSTLSASLLCDRPQPGSRRRARKSQRIPSPLNMEEEQQQRQQRSCKLVEAARAVSALPISSTDVNRLNNRWRDLGN
jgi:hypothetical protein